MERVFIGIYLVADGLDIVSESYGIAQLSVSLLRCDAW